MITVLSTLTLDLSGSVQIDALPESDFGDTRRRAFRIPTIDGGAVANDYGFSYSDRNFTILWNTKNKVYEDNVDRLCSLYSRLKFACHLGIFIVVPQSYRIRDGQSELQLLVLEKL
jgi:hypothetical protein